MKNMSSDGCRKSSGEDFDFLQLSAGSALLQSIPTDPLRDLAQIVAVRAYRLYSQVRRLRYPAR
jgi:hypothetical protein